MDEGFANHWIVHASSVTIADLTFVWVWPRGDELPTQVASGWN